MAQSDGGCRHHRRPRNGSVRTPAVRIGPVTDPRSRRVPLFRPAEVTGIRCYALDFSLFLWDIYCVSKVIQWRCPDVRGVCAPSRLGGQESSHCGRAVFHNIPGVSEWVESAQRITGRPGHGNAAPL